MGLAAEVDLGVADREEVGSAGVAGFSVEGLGVVAKDL